MYQDPDLHLTSTSAAGADERTRRVLAYHERTKHHPGRYARSLGYLDWATQPNPFRTFAGSPVVELPLVANSAPASYAALYVPGAVSVQPLQLASIAALFELSLGLSAWKQFGGNRWALRCNPSSGNLHPTEGYAVLPALPQISAGLYHYVSRDHSLELRCELTGAAVERLVDALPAGGFLVGLSSVHWREAWKYGERAFRYCQHDVGHAIATVRYAAAALGWSATLLCTLSDSRLAALLGLDRDADFVSIAGPEREHPCVAIAVYPGPRDNPDIESAITEITRGNWVGAAGALSSDHVEWEVIDEVAAATRKPPTAEKSVTPAGLPRLHTASDAPAATLIRQRRSCLALDGRTAIPLETFYEMLDHLLPRPETAPWDALPWPPQIHAVLFVHRVDELPPGLYLLERSQQVHDRLRAAFRKPFVWTHPLRCPDHLGLFVLAEGDFRSESRTISCHQEIASDGAFSLGMLADFGETIRAGGAWWYRRLFWEAGMLGQVLYLEAEAAGVRSTGIGCYFDDSFHQVLGLNGDHFQSLYHFTVGAPVEDARLTTLEPYAHLGSSRRSN